jgi:hypothetical protein
MQVVFRANSALRGTSLKAQAAKKGTVSTGTRKGGAGYRCVWGRGDFDFFSAPRSQGQMTSSLPLLSII